MSDIWRYAHRLKQLCRILMVVGLGLQWGCERSVEVTAAELAGGDPQRGRAIIWNYGCGTCHTIPGVRGANGLVGPPLNGIARRVYLAGVLPNTPDNMIRWLQNPQDVQRWTAMPDTGLTEDDARDIASFLYTLR
ncbi:MAG TPA: c-type cytochrome [Alphaproteobacteria bacterium]|nr:c-type cytochrome [Alphaproteobacteria bacterium]